MTTQSWRAAGCFGRDMDRPQGPARSGNSTCADCWTCEPLVEASFAFSHRNACSRKWLRLRWTRCLKYFKNYWRKAWPNVERISPIVSAARTKLFWYFRLTMSFEIPGYVWNLCLLFWCFFEARWAFHEHSDWHVTEQWEHFHSFLSFARIWCSASSLSCFCRFDDSSSSCFCNLSVSSRSSFGGRSGGIFRVEGGGAWKLFVCIWMLCDTAPGGGIPIGLTGIGLYRLALSVCFSLVTWSSQSSYDFDKYPQITQFRLIDRLLIKCLSWFLCFLERSFQFD